MMITIPTWIIYALYVIGGIAALVAMFVVCSLAFVGWITEPLLSNHPRRSQVGKVAVWSEVRNKRAHPARRTWRRACQVKPAASWRLFTSCAPTPSMPQRPRDPQTTARALRGIP